MHYLVQRHLQQYRTEMEAAQTCKRKTVTIDEMRKLLNYDGKELDHAKILQMTGASTRVGDTMYSVSK